MGGRAPEQRRTGKAIEGGRGLIDCPVCLLISFSVERLEMGTGGSRYGAGRPAHHVKAEHCLSIEAWRWAKKGIFSAHGAGTWVWTNTATGEESGRIGYSGTGGAVQLNFTVNGEPVRQLIPELRTACNYGGSRSWFACPRCHRRVGVLYLRGATGFICRHCGRVAYASQSEDVMGRTWLKQHKAEKRLRDNWRRPRGMHQTTREKLLDVIADCEERRDAALMMFMARRFPGGFKL